MFQSGSKRKERKTKARTGESSRREYREVKGDYLIRQHVPFEARHDYRLATVSATEIPKN
jgi:hypothetical protein